MTKLLIGLLSLALVGTGGLISAVGGFGGADPAFAESTIGDTTTVDTTTTAGTTTGRTTRVTVPAIRAAGAPPPASLDRSGPCDEGEHANDPRCSGGRTSEVRDDDTRDGSGHGSRSHGDDDDSSGRGSSGGHDDDRNDSSGRGSGDDD